MVVEIFFKASWRGRNLNTSEVLTWRECREYFRQREQLEERYKVPHVSLGISQWDSLSLEKPEGEEREVTLTGLAGPDDNGWSRGQAEECA